MYAGDLGADLFHLSYIEKAVVFVLCLFATLALIILGAAKELKAEAKAGTEKGRFQRMLALYGMLGSGLAFSGFAAAYFWPAGDEAKSELQQETTSLGPNWNANDLQHSLIDEQSQVPKITTRTPKELLDFYKGITGLQAYELIKPYLGMRIRATGQVGLLMPDGRGFVATLAQPDGSQLECRFNQSLGERLGRYNRGDQMSVLGVITPNQNGSQLYLGACSIIET